MASQNNALPSLCDIWAKTVAHFGLNPCLWQMKVTLEILKCKGDIISIAATGEGKTLTFWMPLLFSDGIQLIISPLNILLEQNIADLDKLSISAVGIYADTATPKAFKVRIQQCLPDDY
jgi:superfamily II DNA helicase RecQ